MNSDIFKSPVVRFNLLKTLVLALLAAGLGVAAILSRRNGDAASGDTCAMAALGCVLSVCTLWQHSGLPREGDEPKPAQPEPPKLPSP